MSILIKNGIVYDPKRNIDGEILDLFINNGKISKLEKNINCDAEKTIDANGMWVVPGFIDLHVHLREPGYEYKETILTGSRAAAAGGYTSICCMPNTNPVVDNKGVVALINKIAKEQAIVNILPVGSITKGQNGKELSNILEMKNEGIYAISEDGKTVENIDLMKEAFRIAKKANIPILSHCEDIKLVNGGVMNFGEISKKLGLKGISNRSEDVIIERDILLSDGEDATLHICHISTKGGIQLLRKARKRRNNVTGEVCPHHFCLYDEIIDGTDSNFKMNPPLRSKEDVQAVIEGLRDGTVSVIATDHAPHHESEKNCSFENASNGIIGIETALSLCITKLVNEKILTPYKLIEKMSTNPAEILGIDKGSLSIGSDADVTIVDPNLEYKINKSKFLSKSKNSPFDGWNVKGKVIYTIISGEIVYDNRQTYF